MKYCCSECFKSRYLRDIISSETELGDCDFCGTTTVKIYEPDKLADILRGALSIYKVNKSSPQNVGRRINKDFYKELLSEKIKDATELLESIFIQDEILLDLLKNNVDLSITLEEGGVTSLWSDFKKEIKNENRFHLRHTVDLSKLKNIFLGGYINFNLKKGKSFFRGRISTKEGFSKDKMGNPPIDKAMPGRANPRGISYLYLATDIETTLREVRAGKYDYITVAEFVNIEDINILDLHNMIFDPGYWIESDNVKDYLRYKPFLEELVKDLSKPIRKKDKEIDYIPSQYISEFCKSIGFDGIAYDSSFSESGFNYAMFNPEKFRIRDKVIYHIDNVDLTTTPKIISSI